MNKYFLVAIVDNISGKFRTIPIADISPIVWYAEHVQSKTDPTDTCLIGFRSITKVDYDLYVEHVEDVIEQSFKI